MNWLLWLNMLVAVGVNVHALVALVISRRKPAPALRRLAKRSGFLAMAFIIISFVLLVLAVRQATSDDDGAEPAPRQATSDNNGVEASPRAMKLAMQIAVGMNCAAVSALGAMVPLFATFWLWKKAKRS